MIFETKIMNSRNETLTLTENEKIFQIISIEGLNPPKAKINTSTIAGLDGARFNSSKLETREIVITIKINGEIERNRQYLYTFFATKEWCKFYFKNENRDVWIDCYVENFECDLFKNGQTAQISLLCPQPYFKDINEIIDNISKVIPHFEFPFSFGANNATIDPDSSTDDAIIFSELEANKITNIFNSSSSKTGMIIEISIIGSINKIQIRNTKTGEDFVLNYNFLSGDKVIINTNKGEKTVTLIRNGISSNIFGSIQRESVFFQLNTGDNFFGYLIDDGDNDDDVYILFKHYTLYRGV